MIPSVVQVSLPTSNTTFNITDASISSNWKGSIFFGSEPATNASNTANACMYIGATDGTRNVGFSCSIVDATAGAAAQQRMSATNCVMHMTGGTLNVTGAYSATISNGVTLALSANDGTAHKLNSLNFSGTDVEFACSSVIFATTDVTKTFAHNLTGTPDAFIIIICNGNIAMDSNAALAASIGFWDGSNQVGSSILHKTASNPTVVAARTVGTDLGHFISTTPTDFTSFNATSVGVTNLTINKGSAGGTAATVMIMAWRHTSGTSASLATVNTTPNATGLNTVNSGMAVAPLIWVNTSTRLISTSFVSDDTSGSWGLGISCNNQGVTQQMAVAVTTKQGVATSVAKSQVTATAADITLDNTGAVQFSSTVNAWNSGGVQESVVTAPASAFERINLAWGMTSAVVSGGNQYAMLLGIG